jgi:hypothetical protein
VPLRPRPLVALFNASDDTIDIVRRMLEAVGFDCIASCRLADLKHGRVNFGKYLAVHEPDVFLFDVSLPYTVNWKFCQSLAGDPAMVNRGLVWTTPNKQPLDAAIEDHSATFSRYRGGGQAIRSPANYRRIRASLSKCFR